MRNGVVNGEICGCPREFLVIIRNRKRIVNSQSCVPLFYAPPSVSNLPALQCDYCFIAFFVDLYCILA